MINSPLLRDTGAVGIFNPLNNTVGLSFDLQDLFPRIIEPTIDTWPKTLQAFHEWAHFYQFATSSYGFYYRLLTFNQLYLINGLLHLYAAERGRKTIKLPLLAAGQTASFEDLQQGPKWSVHLRMIYLLEQVREAVFGVSPFPMEIEDTFHGEYHIMTEVLYDSFRTPKLAITRIPDDIYQSGAARYRIHDLLESHAHALSSLWLMQAVERYELPRQITEELLSYANEVAEGPYAAFLRYTLPVEPRFQLHAFCTLCELALNPPTFHFFHPEQPERLVMFPDKVWSPVERIWSYVLGSQNQQLPVIDPSRGDEYLSRYLEALKDRLEIGRDHVLPFLFPADNVLDPLLDRAIGIAQSGDVPEGLGLTWLDSIGTYQLAEEIRQSHPLLIGGRNIEELDLLFRTVGGPIAISHINGRQRFFPRVCGGLLYLGLLDQQGLSGDDQSVSFNEAIIRTGLEQISYLTELLYQSKGEIQRKANKTGYAWGTISDFLAFYGLRLEDFA